MFKKTYNRKLRCYEFEYDIIDDSVILLIFIKSDLTLNLSFLQNRWLDKHLDIKHFLDTRYCDSNTYKEIIYRLLHKIERRPVCPICGKLLKFHSFSEGYYKYCSRKCASNDLFVKLKREETNLEKYGSKNILNALTIKEKTQLTLLKRYGVDNAAKSEHIKVKRKNTCLKRYGVDYVSLLKENEEKRRLTCLEKYGETCMFKTEKCKKATLSKEAKAKSIESKRKNHTFNSSKIEKLFEAYLNENFVDDFETLFFSEKYPFHCDFYIKSLDLYIEIQGSWTHGPHPFKEDDENDISLLNKWKSKNSKFYDNAIKTWSIRDVKKRNIAKQNTLKYLEIFSNNLEICIVLLKAYISSLNLK